jgi:D-aspartate ligase
MIPIDVQVSDITEPTAPKSKWTKPVGAVVLGGDYQGLGIVRSLGRHGIPVCIVDDEASIAKYSKFATLARQVPSLFEARETVNALMDLGKEFGLQGWVIFPTRDEQVASISKFRDELSAIYRVPTPGWDSIKWLWDKRNTYSMAKDLGIPTPCTWYPGTLKDLDQIGNHFPVAIKPAIKEHFIYATKDKAWRADNPRQLRELVERACRHIPIEEVMIQDFVPGDGDTQYAYCSFFKDGNSVGSLMACRRRQHPLEFGRASTHVETVNVPLLEEYSLKFLRAINYYGLVELEYKQDPRDGKFRLLDVNGRTWGYHTIGRPAGVDFPYMLFADQLDQPVEARKGEVGIRWLRLLTDMPTGVIGITKGKMDAMAYLRSLGDYHEEAVFSYEDPMPGIMEIALLPYLSIKRGF